MPRSSPWSARSVVAGLTALAVTATSCSAFGGGDLVEQSEAEVLVPTDVRYLDQWNWSVQQSADNYTAVAHASAEFDPDVDPELVIESYQINDSESWDGTLPAEDPLTEAAFVSVLDDSLDADAGGPCEVFDPELEVQLCSYDVERGDPLPIYVRRFTQTNGNEVVMLVVGTPAGPDYVTGNFRMVNPRPAEIWLEQ